jgi:Ras-related protein Rab-8A
MWFRNVNDHADDEAQITLVGTKCDLVQHRAVSKAECEELARTYSVPYLETSAKEDIRVSEVFESTARRSRAVLLSKELLPHVDKGRTSVILGSGKVARPKCCN